MLQIWPPASCIRYYPPPNDSLTSWNERLELLKRLELSF